MRPLAQDYVERSLWETKGRVTNLEHRPPPISAEYEIKLYDDTTPITASETSRFVFAIPEDLDGLYLLSAEAFFGTVASSSSSALISITNLTQSRTMLGTNISIDSGEFVSYFASTRSVVDLANSQVAKGDRISINVLSTNTGQGAGVILRFGIAEPVVAPLAPAIATILGAGALSTTLARRSTTYGYF